MHEWRGSPGTVLLQSVSCPEEQPQKTNKDTGLPVSWPSHQFLQAVLRYRLSTVPAQGGNMSEFISWVQGNWQALGTLLTQLAFLVAGVWFARNIPVSYTHLTLPTIYSV